jgi:hypothetical protein
MQAGLPVTLRFYIEKESGFSLSRVTGYLEWRLLSYLLSGLVRNSMYIEIGLTCSPFMIAVLPRSTLYDPCSWNRAVNRWIIEEGRRKVGKVGGNNKPMAWLNSFLHGRNPGSEQCPQDGALVLF